MWNHHSHPQCCCGINFKSTITICCYNICSADNCSGLYFMKEIGSCLGLQLDFKLGLGLGIVFGPELTSRNWFVYKMYTEQLLLENMSYNLTIKANYYHIHHSIITTTCTIIINITITIRLNCLLFFSFFFLSGTWSFQVPSTPLHPRIMNLFPSLCNIIYTDLLTSSGMYTYSMETSDFSSTSDLTNLSLLLNLALCKYKQNTNKRQIESTGSSLYVLFMYIWPEEKPRQMELWNWIF